MKGTCITCRAECCTSDKVWLQTGHCKHCFEIVGEDEQLAHASMSTVRRLRQDILSTQHSEER